MKGWLDSSDDFFKAVEGLLHQSSVIIGSINTNQASKLPSGRKFPRAQILVIFVNYKVVMNFFHRNLGVPCVLLNTETRAECRQY